MADFSVTQTDFRGGHWSYSAQGKIDDPRYKTALGSIQNWIPLEEGALTRRPGFMDLGPTYLGLPAMVRSFAVGTSLGIANLDVVVELTSSQGGSPASYLRFWAPATNGIWNLLPDNYALISSISLASPAVVTISAGPSPAWATGDIVYFIQGASALGGNAGTLLGRQIKITKLTDTTYELYDMLSGAAIDGSGLNYTSTGADWLAHVKILTSLPYTDKYPYLYAKMVQEEKNFWIFYPGYCPYILSLGASISTSYISIPFSFTLAKSSLISASSNNYDGPYLDPPTGTSQTGNDTATLSSMSSTTPALTVTTAAFTAVTDVGRQIRVWNQPPLYADGTSYSVNDTVTFNGAYYQLALAAAAGTKPGQTLQYTGVSQLPWNPVPKYALWRYGVITAVSSSTVATLKLNLDFSAVTKNGTLCDTYQLGLYTDTGTVFPTNAMISQGRLVLFGAVPNRFDASASNAFQYVNADNQQLTIDALSGTATPFFSPTDQYGAVGDGNAIAYTLNFPTRQSILWMEDTHEGWVCGTIAGEFIIEAPSAGAISPTNIAALPTTDFGSSTPAQPVRVGACLLFVQTLGIEIIEYLADVFKAKKYVGRQINTDCKDLFGVYGLNPGGIKNIAYQEAPVPTLWAARWDGFLLGCTYRRNGGYATTPPDMYGWHYHTHGAGRTFVDICVAGGGSVASNSYVGPVAIGNAQTLVACTVETSGTNTGKYYVEALHPLFREADQLPTAFFVDGVVPFGAITGTDGSVVPAGGCSVFGGGPGTGADITLSNGNLTATGQNIGSAEIAQSCQVTPGYFYFEVTCDTVTTADNDGVGISLKSATAANIANSWTNGYGFGTNNHTYFNGSSVGSPGALTTGDYLAISVDLVHGNMVIAKETTPGIDPYGTNNPGLVPTSYSTSWSTNVGTDISAIFNNVNATLTALFRANTVDAFTVNNGPTFRFLKPMGMSTGWNGRDYNTPCGFASASEVGVLSHGVGNDYYGMTLNGATANTGARSKFGIASGKYYMEWSTSQRGGNEYFGVCDTTYTVGAVPGTHFKALNCPYSNQHGELCVDFTAKLMWIRGKHSDSWTGGGDPTMGTGGTDLSALSGSYYFAARSTLSGTVFLCITDPKGMLNSPPSGFTAGWPTS